MSDASLRELARLQDDPIARYRYRVECVRAGRPEDAGLEVGDRVLVTERPSRFLGLDLDAGMWSAVPWTGRIVRRGVSMSPSSNVMPDDWDAIMRDRRARQRGVFERSEAGLFLDSEDRLVLIEPHPD